MAEVNVGVLAVQAAQQLHADLVLQGDVVVDPHDPVGERRLDLVGGLVQLAQVLVEVVAILGGYGRDKIVNIYYTYMDKYVYR